MRFLDMPPHQAALRAPKLPIGQVARRIPPLAIVIGLDALEYMAAALFRVPREGLELFSGWRCPNAGRDYRTIWNFDSNAHQ